MTETTAPLQEKTRKQVRKLCQQGYDCYDKQELKAAIRHFAPLAF